VRLRATQLHDSFNVRVNKPDESSREWAGNTQDERNTKESHFIPVQRETSRFDLRATRIHVSSTLILLLLFLPGILVFTPANVYGKNNTTLVITLSGPTIAVGQSVTVSSTLSGATATAGDTVSYMLYSNPTCTPAASKTNTATVLNHVPGQTTFSPSVGGTFSINAVYSGDGANNPSPTSLCKQLIVSKTVTTTTTTITSSLSFPVGGAVTDTSSLSGANHATATGTVTYSIYQGSVCTGPVFLSSGALTITIPAHFLLPAR